MLEIIKNLEKTDSSITRIIDEEQYKRHKNKNHRYQMNH